MHAVEEFVLLIAEGGGVDEKYGGRDGWSRHAAWAWVGGDAWARLGAGTPWPCEVHRVSVGAVSGRVRRGGRGTRNGGQLTMHVPICPLSMVFG